jgi:hypothetical protein
VKILVAGPVFPEGNIGLENPTPKTLLILA